MKLTLSDLKGTELGHAIDEAKNGEFAGCYESVEDFVKAMNDVTSKA